MNFNDDGAAGLSYRKSVSEDRNGFLNVERSMAEASHTETTKAMTERPTYKPTETGFPAIWEVAAEINKKRKAKGAVKVYVKNIDSTRCM